MPRVPLATFLLGIFSAMTYCTFANATDPTRSPHQFSEGKFRNPVVMKEHSVREMAALAWTFMFGKKADTITSGGDSSVSAHSRAAACGA